MRVLVVEPNANEANLVAMKLEMGGHNVDVAHSGQQGLELAAGHAYDVIVLELLIPDMSGFEWISRLRSEKVNSLLIIISTISLVEDKVRALDLGADDYLTKPLLEDELLLHLCTVIRRNRKAPEQVVRCGDLMVNIDIKSASVMGKRLLLTPKEYLTLEGLSLKVGELQTKKALVKHVYDDPIFWPLSNQLEVYVARIRGKIAAFQPHLQYIETFWNYGYLLRSIPRSI